MLICTKLTGMICYSKIGGGSCRKGSNFGQFGFQLLSTGRCDSVKGRNYILNKEACEDASKGMSLNGGHSANEGIYSRWPRGCVSYFQQSLYYNRKSSTSSCSDQVSCLCVSAPDCQNIYGEKLNNRPCLCGEGFCSLTSGGQYCTKSSTVLGSNSFCAPGPPCANTNGTVVNSQPCKCKNKRCTASTGLICYSVIGDGTCRKINFGMVGYSKLKFGKCLDTSERKLILDKSIFKPN